MFAWIHKNSNDAIHGHPHWNNQEKIILKKKNKEDIRHTEWKSLGSRMKTGITMLENLGQTEVE